MRRPAPTAEWTYAPEGPAFLAYSTIYLIEVRHGVIVFFEAISAHRIKEVDAARTMIDRLAQRFAMKPNRLIDDLAYGSAELVDWMVNDAKIE